MEGKIAIVVVKPFVVVQYKRLCHKNTVSCVKEKLPRHENDSFSYIVVFVYVCIYCVLYVCICNDSYLFGMKNDYTIIIIPCVGINARGYIRGRPLPLIPKYNTQAPRVAYIP